MVQSRQSLHGLVRWRRRLLLLLPNNVFWGPSKLIYVTHRLGKSNNSIMPLWLKNQASGRIKPNSSPGEGRRKSAMSGSFVLARYYVLDVVGIPSPPRLLSGLFASFRELNIKQNSDSHAVF